MAQVVQPLHDILAARSVALDERFGRGAGRADTRLLALEVLESDGLDVVSLHEAIALFRETVEFARRLCFGLALVRQERVHVVDDDLTDCFELAFADADRRPVVLHHLFEHERLGGFEPATVFESLAPEAVEIVVEVAETIP